MGNDLAEQESSEQWDPKALDWARAVHAEMLATNSGLNTRAQVALTLDGVLLGAISAGLLANSDDVRAIVHTFNDLASMLAAAGGVALILSILSCVLALFPTHMFGRPSKEERAALSAETMWFFPDVASHVKRGGQGKPEFIERSMKLSPEDEARARCSQVATMAPYVLIRGNLVGAAFIFIGLALILFALSAGVYIHLLDQQPETPPAPTTAHSPH
jgi:hypothetical protein